MDNIDKIKMLYGGKIKAEYKYGVLLENQNEYILIDKTGKKHIIDKGYCVREENNRYFVGTNVFCKNIIVDMETGKEIDNIGDIRILWDCIVLSSQANLIILNHNLEIIWKQSTEGCIQSIGIRVNTPYTLWIDAVVEVEYSDRNLYIEYDKKTNNVYSRWDDDRY